MKLKLNKIKHFRTLKSFKNMLRDTGGTVVNNYWQSINTIHNKYINLCSIVYIWLKI